GALQVAVVLLELGLELFEQRERVRGAAGEAREDLSLIESAYLARAALDHGLAEADLAVAGDHHLFLVTHGQDRRAVHRVTSLGDGHRRTPSSSGRGSH